MTDLDESRPTRAEVVTAINDGRRDLIGDADRVEDRHGRDAQAIHLASNGSVGIEFEYGGMYESTVAGQVIGISPERFDA
jgi:hypothetical protein